jgi:hypothetical protein
MMKVVLGWADDAGEFLLSRVHRERLSADVSTKRTWTYLQDAGYVTHLGRDRFKIDDAVKIDLLKELVGRRRPDGRLRVIMFDIPEKFKMSRNLFRKHLVDLGFSMQQKSVWASQLPCEDLVELVVKYHGLNQYVKLLVGEIVPISRAVAL